MADEPWAPRLDLLEDELARELQRKTSLEQRGITVITASGAFVTLVFGFSALVTKGAPFANFSIPEKVFLLAALGLFVFASIFGVAANIPRPMGQLRSAKSPPENDPARYYDAKVWEALRSGKHPETLADEMSDAIATTKESNQVRAQNIRKATTLQTLAITAIGIAVGLIIFYPPHP